MITVSELALLLALGRAELKSLLNVSLHESEHDFVNKPLLCRYTVFY